MTPRKKRKSAPPVPVTVSAADRIGALPDILLQHVLSFLPAQESVRTCVLSRRWRHLWKSTRALRIVGLDSREPASVEDLRVFVDHLLMLRDRTDLESVEMRFHSCSEGEVPYVSLWTRFALMCKVRALAVEISHAYFYPDDLLLASRYLKTLDLYGLGLQKAFLDFAGCPALEDLKMSECNISVDRMSSPSLKHLSITGCLSDLRARLRISTPGLVSLKLDDFFGKTPFLENMELLQIACVNLGKSFSDVCMNYNSGVFCGDNKNGCVNCLSHNDGSSGCVLLGGISSAKHLELISESSKFIFTRDLKCCPTFSKLKTLLLNEYWCEAPDLDPLACILKNSPVLEKLTLQLFSKGPTHKVEMKGSYSRMEGPSAISEHLNIVEVKCNVVDEKILKVLKFLSAFNIRKLTNDSLHDLYVLKLAFICGNETNKKAGSK
ncbi:MEIOTIC F-BOX protein MOF-like [Aegilops tauschii subsp. strangulata]|nr:MEIOTIC F-BOX protein MOF-like [Aegilops tauschii subsp. strangulata]